MPTIFVAGHRGMVGSAILRALHRAGHTDLLVRTRAELDLTRQAAVEALFDTHAIDTAYLAAARVGGIGANAACPAEFIAQNLAIQTNVVTAAHRAGVKRLLFLGSSCIYPRDATQPMAEDALLTGPLEATNDAYAIAKIAGIKLCEAHRRQYGRDYRSAMPTNLYGPGDNYHPDHSHVLPALIRRLHQARIDQTPEVVVWGTGTPLREFLHVDDLAAACLHLMDLPAATWDSLTSQAAPQLNIGSGQEISIAALAQLVARVVGYQGTLRFDPTRPDGTPRKLMDSTRLSTTGWTPTTPLLTGLATTYADFLDGRGR